ncbi:MAG: tetratricopeptide repeat protein [Anaerolineaceae bacterium]|nr:tetratricopeptide repeat protein [Anaerolineaceae bacterium]
MDLTVDQPLLIIALLAVVLMLIYYRSVKDQRGLEYLYNLFQNKLTREQFYNISRLVILLIFWGMVITMVLLVGSSMVNVIFQGTRLSQANPTVTPNSAPMIKPAYTPQYTVTIAPESTAMSLAFQPAQSGETLVIIAPFEGNGEIHPEYWIEDNLQKEIPDLPDRYNVRIEVLPSPITHLGEQAIVQHVKEVYQPTILVWGWYDQMGITANYSITEEGLLFDEYQPTLAQAINLPSSPDAYVFYITQNLPEEIAHLTFFEMSQIYYTHGDFERSMWYLQKALDHLSPDNDKARASLYYLMALDRLQGFDDTQSAITYTEQALAIDPNHFPSLALHGNTCVLKDILAYIQENHIIYSVDLVMESGEPFFAISSDQPILLETFGNRQALADYQQVVKLIPDRAEPYYLRGMQYYALGYTEEAIQDMQHVIQMKSEGSFLRQLAEQYIDAWNRGTPSTAN